MKNALHCAIASVLAVSTALAESPVTPKHLITVRQELEIYAGLTALEKGGFKVVDGKESHVPFVLTSLVRWTLSGDLDAVTKDAVAYGSIKDKTVADEASKISKDDQAGQAKLNSAVDKALDAILDRPE